MMFRMKIYIVELTDDERMQLEQLIRSGKRAAQQFKRAMILLKADRSEGGPGWPDARICEAFDVGTATVNRVRKTFVLDGLDAALRRKSYDASRRVGKIDGDLEAKIVALCCGDPPVGFSRWSLRLLADRVVELGWIEEISHETIRRTLKKTS